jgi:hypothetical protein
MGTRAALAAGTVLSLAVTAGWSWTASLTIGPAAHVDLDLSRPLTSYATLADAPTGNGSELFAVVAVIYALCLLASGWRQQRRWRTGGGA